MRKSVLMIVYSAIAVTGAVPAVANDEGYSDREYRQHRKLERQHAREDYRLEQQHAAAHYYGISRKADRRLHRRLERQEHRFHHRLEDRHERQHDRGW